MAKISPSPSDKRQTARDKARSIAQQQAQREKTAQRILYSGIAVVVCAVAVVVTVLLVQAAKPVTGPSTYVSGSITLAKDDDSLSAIALDPPADVDIPSGVVKPAATDLNDKAAKVKVYLDFQCPACAAFEEINGDVLEKLVHDGTIALQYYPLAMLDRASSGNEYSTRAANMAACVADSGQVDVYPELVKVMFANQPEEGGNGMTDEQMLAYAERAGVDLNAKTVNAEGATVRECVKQTSFEKVVANGTQKALDSKINGTPSVFINGKQVESWQDPKQFAAQILKAAGENR